MIKIQTRVKNLLGFQAQNENQNQNYKNKKIRLASDFFKSVRQFKGTRDFRERRCQPQVWCPAAVLQVPGLWPREAIPTPLTQDIFCCHDWGMESCWHQVGSGQQAAKTQDAQNSPTWLDSPATNEKGVEVEKPSWEEQLWAHQDSGSPVYLYPSWRICGWTLDNQEMKGKMWARGLVKTTSRIYL